MIDGLRGGPPEPSPLRTELRGLVRLLDTLEDELAAHEGNRSFVAPRPLAEIVTDIEHVAASLRGWVARAKEQGT